MPPFLSFKQIPKTSTPPPSTASLHPKLLLEKNNQVESLYSAEAIVTKLIFLLFGILFC